ncbi:mRNA splicing protein [Friedmanniomyces endolithicus]|nr:mRNA splicing protein [Friedmanniomyces endolithicus]
MSNKKPADNKSNDRNEYIPSFISKKPFYVSDALASDSDYLEHQRLQNDSREKNDSLANAKWYTRGSTTTTAPKATKYRKGACENCGSMSHKGKDCLQRKRKHGAKWTGRDIAGDEKVEEVRLGWDAKRDRWNGFEAGEYREVVEDFEVVEEMRKRKARAAAGGDAGGDGDDVDGEEGAKYEEETDMGRKQSTSTRQLRLREDTAKYLLNLDLDSAKYDPKTRSMLDTATSTNELIAEDGFQKASGDAAEFERATRYAWETQERGDGDRIHLQANPTEAQLTRKRKAEDDISEQEKRKKELADKYGAQDAVVKKPGGVVAESSERYVEYDERGRIKGAEKERKEKSMYAEDVLVNNHTSVWGSWWEKFQWGYACCHSTVKNSFCTGEEGRRAAEEAELFSKGLLLLPAAEEDGDAIKEVPRTMEVEEDPPEEKTAHAPNAPDRPEKQEMDESRRRMEELKAGVTEEEMERYRKEKTNKSDPMAAMLGRDELVG